MILYYLEICSDIFINCTKKFNNVRDQMLQQLNCYVLLTGEAYTRVQTAVVELFTCYNFVQSNKKGSVCSLRSENCDDRRQSGTRLSPSKEDHQAHLQRC